MIFLNLTAELEETWNEDAGTIQSVVIRMNSQEVARFAPTARIFYRIQGRLPE
jgi:hypothetical protein